MKANAPLALALFSALALLLLQGVPLKAGETQVPSREIVLRGGGLELRVAPDAGGRVVFFGFEGGGNVLKADEAKALSALPEPSPDLDCMPLNGHEIWVAPQEAWWSQQSVSPKRREAKANWPPDPWLALGRFKTLEASAAAATLEGPESPVTGLKLTKSFSLAPDGKALLKVEAKNCRQESVSWGLWSNSRLDGFCDCYAPIPNKFLKVEANSWSPYSDSLLPYAVKRGYFTFSTPAEAPAEGRAGAKAFLWPERGLLAAAGDGFLFLKEFALASQAQLCSAHAPVEVYQCVTRKNSDCLLELEFHGPIVKLKPGGKTQIQETWRLLKCERSRALDALDALAAAERAKP